MKHGWTVLMLGLLGTAGCVSPPQHLNGKADSAPVGMKALLPVHAEQVTPQNAHKQSQALWEELDREVQDGLTGTPAPGKR
jgi:hypothetical protein